MEFTQKQISNHISEEVRRKLSEAHKGKHHSEETRRKMSESHKGKVPANVFKKGHPGYNKGKHLSEETKRKLSEILKGRPSPMRGKKHSVESRKKMSEAQKRNPTRYWLGKKQTEETKRKQSEAHTGENHHFFGKKLSEEHIKKMSESHIGIQAEEKHPLWKGGISFKPYCYKFNRALKERVRNRDNRTCQLCNAKENGKSYHVHHIHYDKENCNPDLITLCYKCNPKVNFNRDYYEAIFMNMLNERGLLFWACK